MAQIAVEMTGDEANLWRSLQKVTTQQRKVERGFEKIERKGKRAGRTTERAFGGQALSNIRNYATGLVSVSAALAAAKGLWSGYIEDIRKFSAAASQAGDELITLAALQEGGKKRERVMQAEDLAARYGMHGQRAAAYRTVQAMQSTWDSWEKGFESAEVIFGAVKAGMELEEATELARLGAGLKQPLGMTLPRAYAAGKASSRSPREIAQAAPALAYWEDVPLGIAAAGVLASVVGAAELKTYTGRGGEALSDISGLAPTFKKLGLLGKSELEKLLGLKAAGLDTIKELEEAGLSEKRERKAIVGLVTNVGKLQDVYAKVLAARPEDMLLDVAAIEEEFPEARLRRQIDRAKNRIEKKRAYGETPQVAQEHELTQFNRGEALLDMGITRGVFGIGLHDEEGRATKLAEFILVNRWGPSGPKLLKQLHERMAAIRAKSAATDPITPQMRAAAARQTLLENTPSHKPRWPSEPDWGEPMPEPFVEPPSESAEYLRQIRDDAREHHERYRPDWSNAIDLTPAE